MLSPKQMACNSIKSTTSAISALADNFASRCDALYEDSHTWESLKQGFDRVDYSAICGGRDRLAQDLEDLQTLVRLLSAKLDDYSKII